MVGLHETVGTFELVGPNKTLGSFDETVVSSQPVGPNKTVGSFELVQPNETARLF